MWAREASGLERDASMSAEMAALSLEKGKQRLLHW
jgi:hypothetical protein